MPPPDPTEARFPSVPHKAGHYESFYLKLCHPEEPLGAWIRYTVQKRPGAAPTGSLWFTLFDQGGPTASKVTRPVPSAGGEDWIRIGEAALGPGRAAGVADSERCHAAWDLRFETSERPLCHLPADWLYRAPLPRTKLVSPAPAAQFDGRITVDGRELEVAGWSGMVGHNWGAQHAERWIWLHGSGFEGAGEATWLDAAIGRIKLGPLVTPWVASGALSVDGERLALGGLRRRVEVAERSDGCTFVLAGRRVRVRGEVEAERRRVVAWVYADPDGAEHSALNCSVADMRLDVEREGLSPLRLRLAGGAAYELGVRERDHGVELQPFPDG
jgi:hypothetical protein